MSHFGSSWFEAPWYVHLWTLARWAGTRKDLPISLKWFLKRCVTRFSKARPGLVISLLCASHLIKVFVFNFSKGKKPQPCKSLTRNELNELSFHVYNSFLTKHLLIVVVTREFPRWTTVITVMKPGWGEGKWKFLNPMPLVCQTTAEEITCFQSSWAN